MRKLVQLSLAALLAVSSTASYSAVAETGDITKGKRLFNRCKACHNLTASVRTRLGPNLDGLFGKKAGTATNYKYSKALTETDIIWTEQTIEEWLKKPNAFLPGNKMTFAGIRKQQDRKDLIAFLKQSTSKSD